MGVGLDVMNFKVFYSHRLLPAYKFMPHLFDILIWEFTIFSDECLGSSDDEGCSEVR